MNIVRVDDFEIIYLTNYEFMGMNFLKFVHFKVIITALLIFVFTLTISGVGFSGKRNTFGVYFSENTHTVDLPERMNQSFQSNAIFTFLNLQVANFSSQEDLEIKWSKNQICSDDYLNEFRKFSQNSFILPANFEYKIQNIKIINEDKMSFLFIGSEINQKNSIVVSQCESNWMVQFNHG